MNSFHRREKPARQSLLDAFMETLKVEAGTGEDDGELTYIRKK